MRSQQSMWCSVMAFAAAFLMALGHSQVSVAGSTTYSITPLGGAEISREITSGHITTDGTLGPLTEANILAMSVNIGVGVRIGNSPGEFEFPLHSETLNLNNAVLLIEGIIEATPTGIVVKPATGIGERNTITLSNDVPTTVGWGSAYIDYKGTILETLGSQSVSGAWMDNMGLGFPASGIIAVVVPEPSSVVLLGLSVVGLMSYHRRRLSQV